jgi:predicted dehydrogenase
VSVRAAVIGVGYLGTLHAEKYASLEGVELVAVVDLDRAKAETLATRLGTRVEPEVQGLVGRVDCVTIATPTPVHFDAARFFLESGIDVLVEKPITATSAEGRALVDLAAARGRILQVGHLERFNPAVRAMLGVIDRPRFIECDRLAPFGERGTDVDVVRDLMIHDLDVILSCVPGDVERIEAVGIPVLSSNVDIANARLRFAGGCIANVTASRVALKRERKIRLFQTDTYVSVDYMERRVRVCRRRDVDGRAEITVEQQEFNEADALRDEVESFVASVRSRNAPVVDGRSGLRALELAERINGCMETV